MELLTRERFPGKQELPVRMVQFGGGNFMRAFLDWMLDLANERGFFHGMAMVVKPTSAKRPSELNAQGGVYTVLERGVQEGQTVQRMRTITCVRGEVNPYEEWTEFLKLAEIPELRYISSNTTESGIAYCQCPQPSAENVPDSFPAKLTALLYWRYKQFSGAQERGLVVLPCELVEDNGRQLRDLVLRHAADWELPHGFAAWVMRACVFCNTLVDRIVPGFPETEKEALFAQLGYQDNLLVAAEPFNFFAIEVLPTDGGPTPQEIRREFPLEKTGADVEWTDDIRPWRARKVRVLNGAHTASVLAAYLCGLDTVGEMMDDPVTAQLLRRAVYDEILPALALEEEKKTKFAEAVLERFRNPFIQHKLLAISLNSISKWRVRVLPSVYDYYKERHAVPAALAFSLSALICFYRCSHDGDVFSGHRGGPGVPAGRIGSYAVRDSAESLAAFSEIWTRCEADIPALVREILGNTTLWGGDLNGLAGFSDAVSTGVTAICREGARAAIESLRRGA